MTYSLALFFSKKSALEENNVGEKLYLCNRVPFSKTGNFLSLDFSKVSQNGQLLLTSYHEK
jgi:hypothetical protein